MKAKRVQVKYLCPDAKKCGTRFSNNCTHSTPHVKNKECMDMYDDCPACLMERPRILPPFLTKEEMVL